MTAAAPPHQSSTGRHGRTRSAGMPRPKLLGSTTPRIYTPPAVEGPPGPCGCGCALTEETSAGFNFIKFADFVGEPLLPWQRWLAIHMLELNPDGTYRFKVILLLVARQNGKTTFMKLLALWRMFVDNAKLVLGVAQSLTNALEVYNAAYDLAADHPELSEHVLTKYKATGNQYFKLVNGARYKVAAANRKAGRGLSVDQLMLDELREQVSWQAWSALSKTVSAREMGLILAASNAGDDMSIVLNHLRDVALVETQYGTLPTTVVDPETGDEDEEDEPMALFEWSAEDGCALDDRSGWQAANPSLGYTLSIRAIKSSLKTDPPDVFRTEVLCQRVVSLDAVVDPAAFNACGDINAPALDELSGRVVLCVDVAPDGHHVTCVGAVNDKSSGKTYVEVLGAWGSTEAARADLDEIVKEANPIAVGWFSSGPASRLSSSIRKHKDAVELKGAQVPESCQESVDLVHARRIVHYEDPLLYAHLTGASRLVQGDTWRFTRRGVGHCDAAYAFAGAVYLARNTPEPVKMPAPKVV